MSDYVGQLRDVRGELSELTREQRAQIRAAQELGVSTSKLSEEYGVSEAAIKRLNEATELQSNLMGKTLVERATTLLGAIQSLDSQGLRPAKSSFDEIVSAMVAAQDVMRSTGQAGEAMYMRLEVARRRFMGLTPEGLIPSLSPFQNQFTSPDVSPYLEANVDAYIQATEMKIDAENRFQAEQGETERAIEEGILIIGESKDAHKDASDAAVEGTDRATAGYGRLKGAVLESAAAVKIATDAHMDWVQAYKDAGFFVADPGAIVRPLDRSGWQGAISGGGPSTIVNVDARNGIYDGGSQELADRVTQAMIDSLRARGITVGA